MPLLVLALVTLLLPYLQSQFEAVGNYIPYVIMAATLQTSTMFGFIYCMVFIDEKDLSVAKIYGVLPVSKYGLVLIRLTFPFLMSLAMTFVILSTQSFYHFDSLVAFLFSFLAALVAPLFALAISILSKNKMAGMTWFKLVNMLTVIPLVMYFIPEKLSQFFMIFPTYWLFKGFDQYFQNIPFLMPVVIGLAYLGLLMAGTLRWFVKRHFT